LDRINSKVKSRLLGFFSVAVMLATVTVLFYWIQHHKKSRHFDGLILAASRKYEVDPALVKAVVWQESRFDASAEGRAGELGLMQIRDAAAGEWAAAEKLTRFCFDQLRDPATNTMAGTWYLARLLSRYGGTDDPVPYALADYNAGRRNVLRWNTGSAATNAAAFVEQISFPGTRRYIQAVEIRRHHYRSQFRPNRDR
jgi:soluble lytic murein transglycosylase